KKLPWNWKPLVAAAAALLLAAGGVIRWKSGWFGESASHSRASQWDSPVLAILPGISAENSKDEMKFADALTSELFDRISHLPETRVIPRSAVINYKTVPGGPARKRIQAMDAELGGVSAVLETSVDHHDKELRVTAVLYDAKTEKRLWGHTYLRDRHDAA